MIKFKVKRKLSGKKIRSLQRKAELHPEATVTWLDEEGVEHKKTYLAPHTWENKRLYDQNKPKKRHVENPTIYEGQDIIRQAPNNIRPPRKVRKTAWKRFKKAFPYVKVSDTGNVIYTPILKLEKFPLNPTPKKK